MTRPLLLARCGRPNAFFFEPREYGQFQLLEDPPTIWVRPAMFGAWEMPASISRKSSHGSWATVETRFLLTSLNSIGPA